MRDCGYQRQALYKGCIMLAKQVSALRHQMGFTLLEVLITIIILAFGLLGLASLQSKLQLTEMESYQRGQAISLLRDMQQRISVNSVNAVSYVTGNTAGTGDSQPTSCAGMTGTNLDICEWSNSLKGAAEKNNGGNNVGAMVDAKGCITQVQAENTASGVCKPGIYRVTVMWQGLEPTVVPGFVCPGVAASNTLRAISSEVAIGLPKCS